MKWVSKYINTSNYCWLYPKYLLWNNLSLPMENYKLISKLISSNSIQQHHPSSPTKVNTCLEKSGWHRKERPECHRFSFILHTDDCTYKFMYMCVYTYIQWHIAISLWFLINSSVRRLGFSHQQGSHVLIGKAQTFEVLQASWSHWWAEWAGGNLNSWATVLRL